MSIFWDCFGAVFGTCFGLVLALFALAVGALLVARITDKLLK